MHDAPLWTVDALRPFTTHDDEDLRAWAVTRLGYLRDPAAAPPLVAALDDASSNVVMRALDALQALGDALDLDLAREPLRRTMLRADLPLGPTSLARELLVRRGDAGAIDETLAVCLRTQKLSRAWFLLVENAPERLRRFADAEGLFTSPRAAPIGAVAVLPYVATLAELPVVYAKLHRIQDAETRDWALRACLLRGHADRPFDLLADADADPSQLVEAQRAAYPRAADDALVARWLSVDAFAPILAAWRGARWGEVIAACGGWCEAVGGDDAAGDWGRALLRLMSAEAKPGVLHARAAVSLAVAAGHRAIERERPFAGRALDERFTRVCNGSEAVERARRATVAAQWRALPLQDDRREAVADAFAHVIDTGSVGARIDALDFAATLPNLPLDARLFRRMEEDAETYGPHVLAYLTAQPAALRALAPAALDAERDVAQREVLEALGRQNAPWATEILRARFDALLQSEYAEDLLSAAHDLGDPSLLPEVLAAWRPDEGYAASVARLLARVGGREGELPEALVRDADAERARSAEARANMRPGGSLDEMLQSLDDEALVVELTCNRCKRSARYKPGRAVVDPDPEGCKRAGWDGVTFEEIVVCKFCGAEDDYTLGSTAMLSIMAGMLGALAQGKKPAAKDLVSSRMVIGRVKLSDGTVVRRASESLRHWEEKTARDPGDAEAWLRLGNVLKRNRRSEGAIAAYRRALALRPKDVLAATGLLEILVEQKRVGEGDDLPARILESLPGSAALPDERAAAVHLAVAACKLAVMAGQPLAMMVSWPDGVSAGRPVMRVSSVDLRRVTRWDRLVEFMTRCDYLGAQLRPVEPGDQGTQLEALIEGDGSLGVRPAAAQQPVVRSAPKIGRNDPCHCGSGKKFKKCHGA